MKNKKGFTLIELLGVIILLGLLLLVGVPTIRSYLRRGEEVYYTSVEKHMTAASGEYMNTYRTLLPRVIGHVSVISLSELEENNYIDKVVDENGNKCIGQIVVKKKKTDSFEYVSCLKCGTRHITDNELCILDNDSDTGFKNNELDNLYDDSDEYRIIVESEEYEADQAEEFLIPEARVEHLENGVWKEINAKPMVSTKKVDTNTIGTKSVTYSYHGAKTTIKVKVVDKVAPTAPEVVIKYNNASGNNYQGNWYSGNLYVEYKSTDYTKKNIIGSGIQKYEYSLDGTTWIEVRKYNDANNEYTDWNIIDDSNNVEKIIPGDGEYNIHVRAVDKAGNTSEESIYNIKIDTHAPECKLVVKSGTPGEESWYKTAITVGYDLSAIDGTTSNLMSSPIVVRTSNGNKFSGYVDKLSDNPGNNTVEINQPGENLRAYGTLTDQAGNVTVCEAQGLDGSYRIKLDPQIPSAPKITVTDGNGVNGRWYTGAYTYETSPKTGVWHINDTTMTFSSNDNEGSGNLSKNYYYYKIDGQVAVNSDGRATNATQGFDAREEAAANIKAVQKDNTTGTTYYAVTCSVAGNCSDNSNYVVKLDKTAPPTPTITASDGNPLGGIWHVNETKTSSNCSESGVWHIENTTLTFSGGSNISGNMYYYVSGGNVTTNSYARPTNSANNSSAVASNASTTVSSNTKGTTYYGIICSVAGKCSGNSNYLLKIDKTTPGAPSMTAHDGKGTGSWHGIADTSGNSGNVTISLGGGSNDSGNIYWYRKDADLTVSQGRVTASTGTKSTSFSHGGETTGTTYYAKVCSVAGKCSNSNSYQVKLDKTRPTVSYNVAGGTYGSNQTLTITASDANFKFMHVDYYLNGSGTSNRNLTSTTKSLTLSQGKWQVYAHVEDQAGNAQSQSPAIGDNNFWYYQEYIIDNNPPSISAKAANTYINYPTSADPKSYFNITYGISGGTTTCTISNTNQLGLGATTVTCTAKSGSGHSASASTVFRHRYGATGNCRSGGTFSNGACHYSSNGSVCGTENCNGYECDCWDCNCWDECVGGNVQYSYSDTCEKSSGMHGCNNCSGSCSCGQSSSCTCTTTYSCTKYGTRWDSCASTTRKCNRCCNTCYQQCAKSCSKTDATYLYYTCPYSGSSLISGTSTCTF